MENNQKSQFNIKEIRNAVREHAESIASAELTNIEYRHMAAVLKEFKELRDTNGEALKIIIELANEASNLRNKYPNEFSQIIDYYWDILPKYQVMYRKGLHSINYTSEFHDKQNELLNDLVEKVLSNFKQELSNKMEELIEDANYRMAMINHLLSAVRKTKLLEV